MTQQKQTLNVLALLAALGMVISCFLPWAEVSAHSSIMGYSSSYKSTSSGMDSGVGIIALGLAVVCIIMIILKSRFAVVPGILNLLFAIMELSGMMGVTSNVYTSFGEGHAGASFGIYVLLASCVGYIIAALIPTKVKIQEEIIQEPVIEKVQVQTKPAQDFTLSKGQLRIVIVITVLFLISLLTYNVHNGYKAKKIKEAGQIESETLSMNNYISEANSFTSAGMYAEALKSAENIRWGLTEISNSQSYIDQYNRVREELKAGIYLTQLAANQPMGIVNEDANENMNDSLAQMRQDLFTEDSTSKKAFPYLAHVTAYKSNVYSEPSFKSNILDDVVQDDSVSVSAVTDDFAFIKLIKARFKEPVTGWIDVRHIERFAY